MRIMLVLDNPVRDLAGLTLLASELAANGATVFITPRLRYSHEVPYIVPDFLILNYLRRKCVKRVGPLLRYGFQLGIVDTEGGIRASMDSFDQTEMQDPALRSKVDCYFSWGTKQADWFVEKGLYSKEQVCVTGNPRFDYYVGKLRDAALAFAPDALKATQGPLIMLNGIFANTNPRFTTVEKNMAALVSTYGYKEEEVRKNFAEQQKSMALFVEICQTLAREFPNSSCIYRPHPFENAETYNALFEGVTNLKVVKEGSVTPWLLRANVLVHPGCTTGFEARFAGVESLLPSWLPSSFLQPTVSAVSSICNSMEEIQERVSEALNGVRRPLSPALNENLENMTKDWFFRSDGKAYKRIAETILNRIDVKQAAARRKNAHNQAYASRSKPKNKLDQLEDWMVRKFEMPPSRTFRNWRVPAADTTKYDGSDKRFSLADVDRVLQGLKLHVPEFASANVRAASAEDTGGYAFGYRGGRSIVVTAG